MISIVIPTLNEADQLAATLAAIGDPLPRAACEVIVVDAGSSDGTAALAKAAGTRVVTSPGPGRAAQMNLGAQQASGDQLLFLHADTRLPEGALARIDAALRDPAIVGGGFARRFAGASRFLRLTAWLADWRCRSLGWFLGDQAIFARRSVFEQLKGYREIDLFEDLDFSRRMARTGKVVTLSPPVISSARRFAARGPLVTTAADLWLTCQFLAGADPQELAARRRPGPAAQSKGFSLAAGGRSSYRLRR
ncbi:MAG: TIGR04283 family arsenosugar biosynthesis glycosyltransferase [Verrucomicrobia bacterium]|nr:TIGR04283 family arsenosugar biosynthesis glycosyltransferase [Verrucomicrobiota bacterium]